MECQWAHREAPFKLVSRPCGLSAGAGAPGAQRLVFLFLDVRPRAHSVASLCLGSLCSWNSGLEVRVWVLPQAADSLASKRGEWGAAYVRSRTFLYSEKKDTLGRGYSLGSTDFFFSPNVFASFIVLKYTFKFWLIFNIYSIYSSYTVHIYNIL